MAKQEQKYTVDFTGVKYFDTYEEWFFDRIQHFIDEALAKSEPEPSWLRKKFNYVLSLFRKESNNDC